MPVIITSNGGTDAAGITQAENLTSVTTVTATGPGAIVYSLAGGADKAKFSINASTGVLTFIAAPDFEAPVDVGANNTYEVIVKATFGAESDTQTITVTITDQAGVVLDGTAGGDVFWNPADPLPAEITTINFQTTNENDTITGGDGADVINGSKGADSMTGGNGSDNYFVDDLGDTVVEASGVLAGTDTVYASISDTLDANVENMVLLGTAAINATGNSGNNQLVGNDGANRLDGNGGSDDLRGGKGNDTYVIAGGDDFITEVSGQGTDTVESSNASTSLVNFANVENLTLTGAAVTGIGNDVNNVIIGSAGDNTLSGGLGNDRLDGNGGTDTLEGGDGDDTYVIKAAGATITEAADKGTDTVESTLTVSSLAANVENITLLDIAGQAVNAINATGNELNNEIDGNASSNTLDGGDGNDILNGLGGVDIMVGGKGDDTYYIDVAGDTVTESLDIAGGGGIDLVRTRVSYTMGANIDNVNVDGFGTVDIVGNALDNIIVGNAMANKLDGGDGKDTLNGGSGADTMTGGKGNDTYYVNQTGDVVVEVSGAGQGAGDKVMWQVKDSSISLTGQFANIEHITIDTSADGVNATGSSGDNILTGGFGDNVLTGLGGNDTLNGRQGSDSMFGGTGDDIYYVDELTDGVVEVSGEGTADTVYVDVDGYTLAANIENGVVNGKHFFGLTGNSAANTLTGNAKANVLDGGAGADTLIGGNGGDTLIGGADKDTLTGGADRDKFVFKALAETTTSSSTADVIADFQDGFDKIDVSAIDAITSTGTGDDTFVVDTDASFSQGEIRVSTSGGNTILEFNNDADTAAEMMIVLTGTGFTITDADFLG